MGGASDEHARADEAADVRKRRGVLPHVHGIGSQFRGEFRIIIQYKEGVQLAANGLQEACQPRHLRLRQSLGTQLENAHPAGDQCTRARRHVGFPHITPVHDAV